MKNVVATMKGNGPISAVEWMSCPGGCAVRVIQFLLVLPRQQDVANYSSYTHHTGSSHFTMENAMPKPMTISATGGDSTVRITIGNEEAVLTAVEVSEAICRLVALRAEMTPRFGPDPLVGDAPQFSHSTGMRWWLGRENNGERDVQLFTLHPGLGWLSQRFDLGQAQYFLDSVHRLLLIKPKKQS